MIAAGPEGADIAGFDWRLSMAEVSAAGPFSRFPGVDRSLAVLAGELLLDICGDMLRLGPDSAPAGFPGDVPVVGRPVGGTVIDLNLMVRRDMASGRLLPLTAGFSPDPATLALILIFAAAGGLYHGGASLEVDRFDAARVDPGAWRATKVETSGRVFVAEISGFRAA